MCGPRWSPVSPVRVAILLLAIPTLAAAPAVADQSFSFSTTAPAPSWQCSVDGGPFAVCTSPQTLALPPGQHTVDMRASFTVPTELALWTGAFPANGTPDTSTIWNATCVCNPTAQTITGTLDPLGSGENVGRYTVTPGQYRTDLQGFAAMSPTQNQDVYISIPVYVPTSEFPKLGANGGYMVDEQYGPPHNGSPSQALSIRMRSNVAHYELWESQDGGARTYSMWQSPPVTTNAWHTMIERIHWSASPTDGFLELWYDGAQQRFANWQGFAGAPTPINDGTRLPMITYTSAQNGGPNYVNVNLYGNSTPFTLTRYQGAVKVGATLASVTPAISPNGP
jgi:Polysaccharide lyase